MKSIIVLFSLIAAVVGSYHHFAAPLVAPAAVVATPWAAHVPQHRFTRTDWVQPGLTYTIPAVAKYQSITPGFTSYHAASVPVVAQAPVVAAAPLVDAHHGHYAAPLFSAWKK